MHVTRREHTRDHESAPSQHASCRMQTARGTSFRVTDSLFGGSVIGREHTALIGVIAVLQEVTVRFSELKGFVGHSRPAGACMSYGG